MYFLAECYPELLKLVGLIKTLTDLLKILIPIGLIFFGMLDLGKAVIAGKEDEMKKAQGTLIKRVVYAVIVFLIITIVQLVFNVLKVDSEKEVTWGDYWYKKGVCQNVD